MNTWKKRWALILAGIAGLAPIAAGAAQQPPTQAGAPVPSSCWDGEKQPAAREIDDPHSGARWILIPDPDRPGGPGRLVLTSQNPAPRPQGTLAGQKKPAPMPVIRAGDRIQVEEHSAVVDATLEAMALGSAPSGVPLRVRLKVGGGVVRAVAVGPGRAVLAQGQEKRP